MTFILPILFLIFHYYYTFMVSSDFHVYFWICKSWLFQIQFFSVWYYFYLGYFIRLLFFGYHQLVFATNYLIPSGYNILCYFFFGLVFYYLKNNWNKSMCSITITCEIILVRHLIVYITSFSRKQADETSGVEGDALMEL